MTDRLAGYRAQQGGGRYGDGASRYGDYRQTERSTDRYQDRRANPFAQQDDRYEMAEVARSTDNLTAGIGGGSVGDMSAFYAEIASIQDSVKSFNASVARIGDLHTRSLTNTDEATSQRTTAQLEGLIEDTSRVSAQLKRRIQDLERRNGGTSADANTRRQQTAFVKSKFVEAIQNYQQVEQQYRTKYKQRIERQFKIVKPDATPDEVRAVVNDEQGGQIFAQDLLNSNRYGESRAAYREVQERHADIKKIEKTLTELAQLFNDMSVIVEQQEETIQQIHKNTVNIDTDVEAGYKSTEQAVESAKGARKKRWICFWILVAILIVVIIIVLIQFKPWEQKK